MNIEEKILLEQVGPIRILRCRLVMPQSCRVCFFLKPEKSIFISIAQKDDTKIKQVTLETYFRMIWKSSSKVRTVAKKMFAPAWHFWT